MVEEICNIEKITSLVNDIENEFETQKSEIEMAIASLKNSIKMDKFEFENNKSKLNKKLLKNKEIYSKLLEEKDYHNTTIENDLKDIKLIEDENCELRSQIEKQEVSNSEIKKDLEEKKKLVIDLKKKIDSLSKSNQIKEKRLMSKVEEYRTYLGIDFQVVNNNKIKVIFSKIQRDESFECYVVLDLNDGYNIVDAYPKINSIERYSLGIGETTNFFDLVKSIRKEFVKEFRK